MGGGHRTGMRRQRMGLLLPVLTLLLAGVLTGTATAKPADRGGDAVVLKGKKLPQLVGAAPGKIVGFAWQKKGWMPKPVQVDERHTLDVRTLYPPGNHPPHVGGDSPAFDLEVYSDPKTRAGADPDPVFDNNDELVFMAADTGGKAPTKAGAPQGVRPGSGIRVAVTDPAGGGKAFLYLFRATVALDQAAGKDYVDYDFRLTSLPPGQTVGEGYWYFHGVNPEDSTVSTSKYRLHSRDRWIEDGMQIAAGKATGINILDREVAQATLLSCGRTEYTFSGRWLEDIWPANDGDTDDEGTYVTAIDGPVRAIRSYMGANSGPYTQREHIYYRDFEQNTVYLRVHPMPALYAWTDYNENAVGMTFRDSKNRAGVPVDGVEDDVATIREHDLAGGARAWQQLTGPQGTVTSVVGIETDIPQVMLASHYLDAEEPPLGMTQCGGDGKSFGASGFGILGAGGVMQVPNTDPRNTPSNRVSVVRTRYFDAPGKGANLADRYRNRVAKPLAGKSGKAAMKKARPDWTVKLLKKTGKARPGKPLNLKLRVVNRGNLPLTSVRVCVTSTSTVGKRCGKVGLVPIRGSRNLTVRVRVKSGARGPKIRYSLASTATWRQNTLTDPSAGP